jgi:sugar phosphate isomerase/epimerase
MKLSISNIAWSEEDDLIMYQLLKELGYDGIEIAPTRIIKDSPYDNISTIKDFYSNIKNEYNLDICSMQSILYGKNERLFGNEEERTILKQYLIKAIDFASAINCKNLVFGSPKNRIINDISEYKIAMDFFKEIGDYAFSKGTTISIEANPIIYGTNFINTTAEAVKLVNDVDSDGFKINVDLGTIIENNDDLRLIDDNIKYINHIHISEPNLLPIERRNINEELKKILLKNKYDRYISIEMKSGISMDEIKSIMQYVKSIYKGE